MKYLSHYLILENVQKSKALLNKLNIPLTSPEYLSIREMLRGHDGYTYWFVNQFFVNKESMESLKQVWDAIQNNAGVISQFKKNIIDLETVEAFWDEYSASEIRQRVKNIYNQFPAKQKEFIDLNDSSVVDLLNALALDKSSDTFIKKISSYKTKKELIDAIKLFIQNKTDGTFTKLLNNIKSTGSEITYSDEKNDIIICQVNYEQIKKLGGDTAWCIVRSKSTFDSYTSSELSRQFIIFLLDVNTPLRKIGVTTDLYGYHTAHDINDGRVSREELIKILEDRGCSISIIYPSKENIKYSSFNGVSVGVLLDYKFTKEEILKHKHVFKANYGYRSSKTGDLSFFTKDEIEKYNLLDRTELKVSDITSFNKDYIIKKGILNRIVGDIPLSYLADIFTLKEISDYAYDKINELDKKFITFLKSKKTYRTKLEFVKSSFFNSDIQYKDRDYYRIIAFKLLDIDTDDFPVKEYYRSSSSEFQRNTRESLKTLSSLGYKLDKECVRLFNINIVDYGVYISENSNIPTNTDKTITEVYVELLLELVNKETNWSTPFDDLDYQSLTALNRQLSNYPDIYKLIYDKTREHHIRNTSRLAIKSGTKHYRDVDISQTFRNIDFFQILPNELTLKNIGEIFYAMSKYEWSELLKQIRKRGYPSSGREIFDMFKYINTTYINIDLLTFTIKNGIDVDHSFEELINILETSNKSNSDMSSIKELFDKSDKYRDKWDELQNRDGINKALEELLKAAEFRRSRSYGDIKPIEWYNKYFNTVKNVDLTKIKGRDAYGYAFSFLFVLLRSDKMEDANSINFDFLESAGDWTYFNKTCLTDISKVIANKSIYNWDHTWRLKLTKEERKKIYDFIEPKISTHKQRLQMQVAYYLYEKTKFNDLVSYVLKTKMNYSSQIEKRNGDIDYKKITFRIADLKPILTYLGECGKFDEIRTLLSKFFSKESKMGKAEKKMSLEMLNHIRLSYSTDKPDDEIYKVGQSEKNITSFRNIVAEFSTISESRIIRWNDFR